MKRWVIALCVVVGCGKGDGKEASSDKGPQVQKTSPDEQAVVQAQAAKEAALQRAAAARQRLAQIENELAELEKLVDKAVQQTVDAQTEAERTAAKENLQQLQASEAALKARATQARADSAAASRMQGMQISKECMDNPLAKGCM